MSRNRIQRQGPQAASSSCWPFQQVGWPNQSNKRQEVFAEDDSLSASKCSRTIRANQIQKPSCTLATKTRFYSLSNWTAHPPTGWRQRTRCCQNRSLEWSCASGLMALVSLAALCVAGGASAQPVSLSEQTQAATTSGIGKTFVTNGQQNPTPAPIDATIPKINQSTIEQAQQQLNSNSLPTTTNLPDSSESSSNLHFYERPRTRNSSKNNGKNSQRQSVASDKYLRSSDDEHLRAGTDQAAANISPQLTQLMPSSLSSLELALASSPSIGKDTMMASDSKKKKKMIKKKKKKMEKKHKSWKKGKKHKKKKYESKKKKGGMSKKKKGKKEKKKWGMEKKGHKKKGNFKKKKWGKKKKMKKGIKKGKKGHKMLKDKGHKKKGFKKVYHKEEWGKKKKWHDIKREKKWNTKQKKFKKKWHQEKGKKYKGKHMKKYHKKNKHGKKYKKEKKEKYKKHKGEKYKKGHKKKKEEYSKKKEGGKKKKMKKMEKKMKKKKG